MDQTQNFFLCDELQTILEDLYEDCNDKREDMIRQIALCHILTNTRNKNLQLNSTNISINAAIMKYDQIFEKFKKKWNL